MPCRVWLEVICKIGEHIKLPHQGLLYAFPCRGQLTTRGRLAFFACLVCVDIYVYTYLTQREYWRGDGNFRRALFRGYITT